MKLIKNPKLGSLLFCLSILACTSPSSPRDELNSTEEQEQISVNAPNPSVGVREESISKHSTRDAVDLYQVVPDYSVFISYRRNVKSMLSQRSKLEEAKIFAQLVREFELNPDKIEEALAIFGKGSFILIMRVTDISVFESSDWQTVADDRYFDDQIYGFPFYLGDDAQWWGWSRVGSLVMAGEQRLVEEELDVLRGRKEGLLSARPHHKKLFEDMMGFPSAYFEIPRQLNVEDKAIEALSYQIAARVFPPVRGLEVFSGTSRSIGLRHAETWCMSRNIFRGSNPAATAGIYGVFTATAPFSVKAEKERIFVDGLSVIIDDLAGEEACRVARLRASSDPRAFGLESGPPPF